MSKSTHSAKADTLVPPEAASLVRTIDGQLYLLGWSRQHPRVAKFLEKVRQRYPSRLLLRLEQIPIQYLKRLSEFLKIYSQCNDLLPKLNLTWDSPVIHDLTADYGGYNQMPMLGWQHLYESLENGYFLMDMPKVETKKNKQ